LHRAARARHRQIRHRAVTASTGNPLPSCRTMGATLRGGLSPAARPW
jgi:hypothetical protein